MTVQELIVELQKYPQTAHIMLGDADTGYLFTDPEVTEIEPGFVCIASENDYGGDNVGDFSEAKRNFE
jgi:hypothetical protein